MEGLKIEIIEKSVSINGYQEKIKYYERILKQAKNNQDGL